MQDREIVENALFHFFQVPVVLVENLLGLGNIHPGIAHLGPGQGHQPFKVGTRDVVVGRRRRHLRQAPQLPHRLLPGFFRHAGGFNFLSEFLDLLLFVGLAQFLLDRLQLFAQVVLALALRDLVLDVRLNLGAELQHLHFPRQLPVQSLEAHL